MAGCWGAPLKDTMKHLMLILLVSLSVACGGESFEVTELDAVGGDAAAAGEAPLVTAATGGSTSTGGKPASGGSAAAGAPVAGAAGGAGMNTGGAPQQQCDLDPTLIAAVLPQQIVWQDAIHAAGDECITCRDATCATIDIAAWGTPTDNGDGSYTFVPNAERPMVPFSVGVNDGMCTEERVCGIKIYDLAVTVRAELHAGAWVISKATVQPYFQANSCATAPVSFADDMSAEFTKATNGLKIPCDD